MASICGLDCKFYRNAAGPDSPSWAEVENIRDLDLSLESGEADVTTRGNNGWEAVVATLKKGSLEFEMVWDTGDPDFAAFLAAWLAKSSIECLALDGPVGSPGHTGLRSFFKVLKCSRSEKLQEAVIASVTIKPTYHATHPTGWYTS